ncbi:hypothetical protein [Streptomyces sp. NPDC005283]|uniref:hypothetical protein n=1 Tax=Streptomyces sp. NPDC005283 TaxID=3156871 RepID=UPI0034523C96
MRKIILMMSVSLDGFIEGPERQIPAEARHFWFPQPWQVWSWTSAPPDVLPP